MKYLLKAKEHTFKTFTNTYFNLVECLVRYFGDLGVNGLLKIRRIVLYKYAAICRVLSLILAKWDKIIRIGKVFIATTYVRTNKDISVVEWSERENNFKVANLSSARSHDWFKVFQICYACVSLKIPKRPLKLLNID